ncbi:MAG: hypothetical protein ACRDDY_03305 [Clostridium sp.]|uniref:hypothetical protein n=1 Tax=Clostridium sp. TaxID=1506 RepID=UPI003EE642C8
MKKLIMVALITLVGTNVMAEEYKYECKGSYRECKRQSMLYTELTIAGLNSISENIDKDKFVPKNKVNVLMMLSTMSSGIEAHIIDKHDDDMSPIERLTHLSNKNFADRTLKLKEALEKVSK